MGRSEKHFLYFISFLVTFFAYIPFIHAAEKLEINNFNFVEKVGNGNGVFQPGETVEVTVGLKSTSATALNTYVTLTSPDTSVSVLQSIASYGNLSAGVSGINTANPLRFSISSTCPLGKEIILPLTITASGYNRTAEIKIIPGSSYISIGAPMTLAASPASTSSWGPIEINKSNGEQAVGDGKTLTVNGKTFARGFGAHALANFYANIPSDATRFTASFGIDDEMKNIGVGNVKVSVKVAGVEKWSAIVTGGTDPMKCDIPVAAGQQLVIVADPNGASTYDHVDIGYPTFIVRQSAATTSTNSGSWMTLASGSTSSWGPIEIDKSNGEQGTGDGKMMTVNGIIFQKGFGVHALAQLNAVAPSYATNFIASFGIDDEVKSCTGVSAKISVRIAGLEKWSAVIAGGMDPVTANVPVTAGQAVAIVVDPNGAGACDHVDVGSPWFVTTVPIVFLTSVDIVDQQSLRFNPTGIPSTASKVVFESISTVGREVGPKVGPNPEMNLPANWPQTFQGYHPGWQIDVRGVAKDASGNVLATTPFTTVTMPGDPTIAWPPVVTVPFSMSVRIINDQTLQFNPVGIPSAAAKITLESVSTVGRESGPKVGPNNYDINLPTTWPKDVMGYHPGWLIDVRAIVKDSAGNILETTPYTTVQMPGDPTLAWPPASSLPAMINPTPGVMLTNSNVTFQWSTVAGVLEHALTVARTQSALDTGTGVLFNGSTGMNLSQSVAGINIDGNSLYVRLKWRTSAGWQSSNYTYSTQGFTTLSVSNVPEPTGTLYPVTNYGARVDDGVADNDAIQRAIDATPAGNTVYFPKGTYKISNANRINMNKAGITLYGESGAILDTTVGGPSNSNYSLEINAAQVTMRNLIVQGCGLRIRNGDRFTVDYNVFRQECPTSGRDCDSVEGKNAICLQTAPINASITNNFFTDIGNRDSFAIFGGQNAGYKGLLIAYNEFIDVAAAVHLDAGAGAAYDNNPAICGLGAPFHTLQVKENYIKGARGMGLEFQSAAHHLEFYDNWFEHPRLSTTRSDNDGSMAFSLILDKSAVITIKRNVVIAPERPDGTGCRVGFEVGGDNSTVSDNYINGINHAIAMNDGVGTASVTARNNVVMNYLKSFADTISNSFPSATRTFTEINNGETLEFFSTENKDIMKNRVNNNLKPGIGGSFKSTRSGRLQEFVLRP